jgi:hypothetical protein
MTFCISISTGLLRAQPAKNSWEDGPSTGPSQPHSCRKTSAPSNVRKKCSPRPLLKKPCDSPAKITSSQILPFACYPIAPARCYPCVLIETGCSDRVRSVWIAWLRTWQATWNRCIVGTGTSGSLSPNVTQDGGGAESLASIRWRGDISVHLSFTRSYLHIPRGDQLEKKTRATHTCAACVKPTRIPRPHPRSRAGRSRRQD